MRPISTPEPLITQKLARIRRYARRGLTNCQIAMRTALSAKQVDVALWVLLGRTEEEAAWRV